MFKLISYFIIFNIVVTIFCLSKCHHKIIDSGLSKNESNFILNQHNKLRKKVAEGKCPGQPKADNMKIMKWDKKLAEKAQQVANTCTFAHVRMKDDRWISIGQNLALQAFLIGDHRKYWNEMINLWYNEHEKYNYPDNSNQLTGHYTQMVWATSEYLGCGYTYYKTNIKNSLYQKLYVCHYGPPGNVQGKAPYEVDNRKDDCQDLC